MEQDDDFQYEEDINAREEDPMDETDDDLSEDAGDPWEEWDMGQWDEPTYTDLDKVPEPGY